MPEYRGRQVSFRGDLVDVSSFDYGAPTMRFPNSFFAVLAISFLACGNPSSPTPRSPESGGQSTAQASANACHDMHKGVMLYGYADRDTLESRAMKGVVAVRTAGCELE